MTLARRCSGTALGAAAAGLLFLVAFGISVSAQTSTSTQETAQDEIVFIPPAIGAPADRVGAATRDTGQDGGVLSLLAPAGGGMTTLGKPPLVWYLADNFAGRMTAQLTQVGAPHDGVEITGETRFRKGFYALDLSRSEIALEPGKIYVWTVVLAEPRSGNVVAAATTYVERAAGSDLAGEAVPALAARGLWFDALKPFVEIELSGKVRIDQSAGFDGLARSAGLVLP
jgi:hypothetical protein